MVTVIIMVTTLGTDNFKAKMKYQANVLESASLLLEGSNLFTYFKTVSYESKLGFI